MLKKNCKGRKVLYFTSIVVLVVALTGCQLEENISYDGMWLGGTWSNEIGGDSFIVDLETLQFEYDDGGWGMGYSGKIRGITTFNTNGTAGVIFIRYSETGKPTDWDWSDFDNPIPIPIEGDYIGIYFRNLTNTTGQFAVPAEEYEDGKFRTPAKATLTEARAAFIEGVMSDYVSFWVTYTKE